MYAAASLGKPAADDVRRSHDGDQRPRADVVKRVRNSGSDQDRGDTPPIAQNSVVLSESFVSS